MKRNVKDTQKFIDAYKEYYNVEEYDVEKDENDEYFDYFVDDFKAMEDCKTYGEIADWFIDYIDNKGVGNGNFTEVLKGEGEYYEELLGYVNDGEYDSVIEAWCDENCFNAIAPWVEKVVNGSINRDEPISEDNRDKLEEWFALEEYESGDDFLAICEKVREGDNANQKTKGEGEKTMNNENFDLPTFGYSLEIGVNELVNFAFNKADGLDIKDCLLEEMEYNQEPFIERLEENLKLPTTEEAEDVYYDIDADEWSSILNVKYADIRDINGYGNGSNPTVTVNVDIAVNIALFNDICEEHGLEIKSEMQSFTKKNMEEVFKNLYNAKKEGRGND